MTARATMPRSLQIIVAFARLAWDWRRLRRRAPEKLPERLRQTLESLGTTFVKIGQGLSLRWDLLPAPFRHALESLHSDVPAFPSAQAVATVEAAFGLPIDRMFRAFDPQPLAAASVAQVHRAVLLDGREAIVKVTRPGVAEQVRADLRLLRRLVSVLQRFWPRLRRQRPLELVDELAAFLHAEIDMTHEARNMRRMATALADVPGVTLPRVHERWVAPQVLVQELSHGRRIEDAYGTPRARELAHLLIDAYVHQFFGAGVFHGDPHPGNLFDLPDGRLCFHDFGTIGYLDAESRLAFAQLIESIAYDDAAGVLDASTTLGFLTARLDRRAYLRAISEVLSELTTLPLAQWSVAEVVWRVTRIGAGENLRLPRHLLVLIRTLFLLENTLRALDPELDLLAELNTRSPRILEVMERARAAAAAGLADGERGAAVARAAGHHPAPGPAGGRPAVAVGAPPRPGGSGGLARAHRQPAGAGDHHLRPLPHRLDPHPARRRADAVGAHAGAGGVRLRLGHRAVAAAGVRDFAFGAPVSAPPTARWRGRHRPGVSLSTPPHRRARP